MVEDQGQEKKSSSNGQQDSLDGEARTKTSVDSNDVSSIENDVDSAEEEHNSAEHSLDDILTENQQVDLFTTFKNDKVRQQA